MAVLDAYDTVLSVEDEIKISMSETYQRLNLVTVCDDKEEDVSKEIMWLIFREKRKQEYTELERGKSQYCYRQVV